MTSASTLLRPTGSGSRVAVPGAAGIVVCVASAVGVGDVGEVLVTDGVQEGVGSGVVAGAEVAVGVSVVTVTGVELGDTASGTVGFGVAVRLGVGDTSATAPVTPMTSISDFSPDSLTTLNTYSVPNVGQTSRLPVVLTSSSSR